MRYILSFLLIVLIAAPATAQSKKEMVAKDIQLEQRIGELEQRYLTGDPAAERLMQRMDALEASQRALTGEIEQLRYERDSLRNDVKALAGDIATLQTLAADMRRHLDAVELAAQPRSGGPVMAQPNGPQASAVPGARDGTMGSAVVDMAELQNIGQQKLMSGDFTGAQLAFKQYIDLNPSAPDVGDAYFWLAETYFVKSGFSEAMDAYIASMRAAPKGDKAPNAMIGLAASLRSLGNTENACQTLDSFPTQFPSALPEVREKADIERQRAGCS